jgi:hypothetical protein
LGRCYQILYIGRKIRITKIALTFAKSGKIKSENGDFFCCQRPADMGGGLYVFRTGKTMGKKGIGSRLGIIGQINSGCEPLPGVIGEFKLSKFHV